MRRDVLVTCRDDGDVVAMGDQCRLHVDGDGRHWLSYRCPKCGWRDVVDDLEPVDVLGLVDAGIDIAMWHTPREIHEPHYSGSRMTPDEILDFHLLVENVAFLNLLREWSI